MHCDSYSYKPYYITATQVDQLIVHSIDLHYSYIEVASFPGQFFCMEWNGGKCGLVCLHALSYAVKCAVKYGESIKVLILMNSMMTCTSEFSLVSLNSRLQVHSTRLQVHSTSSSFLIHFQNIDLLSWL